MLSEETQLWPVSGKELLRRQGSVWRTLATDQDELGSLAEIRSLAMREVTDDIRSLQQRHLIEETSDFTYAARSQVQLKRVSRSPSIYELPTSVVDFQAFYAGRYFEAGRDFTIVGSRLRLTEDKDLGARPKVYARSVQKFTGNLTRFWCRLLGIPTPSTSNSRMLKAAYRGITGQPSELRLRELVAAVFDVPVVKHAAQVIKIDTAMPCPVVITDKETLVSVEGDSVAVEEGDHVAPGDLLFDSVQFYDFSVTRPPAGLSSLRIPARYFPETIQHPIEIGNQTVSFSVTQVGSRIRLRFPISADNSTEEAAFWDYVDAQELRLGFGLAEIVSGNPKPQLSQVPGEGIPLQILWSLWLNLGVSVSVVRLKPTTEHLGRLALLRRLVPPWLTHFVHFDQTEPQPYDRFC